MGLIKDSIRLIKNKEILIVFIYLIAMAVLPGFSYIAALHLIMLALVKKKEWYFKSLMYFVFLKQLNPIFHPPPSNLFMLFVVIIFTLFVVNMLITSKIRMYSFEKGVYFLLLLFAVTSFIGSLYPAFSLIRLVMVVMVFFVVFHSIKRIGNLDLIQFLVNIAIILVLSSLPLVLVSSGYLQPVGYFKGIINHSQTFALMLLPLYMMYLVGVLERKVQNSFFNVVVLGIGFVELWLSGSRAALLAVVIALVSYIILRQKKTIKLKSIISILFVLFGLVLYVSLNIEKVEKKISSFILKHGHTSTIETYGDSIEGRLYLLEVAKNNIKESPLTGIGFNVQTYYQDPVVRLNLDEFIKYIPGTDIMYSRPLEKGNLYSSVFEESGVLAGLFFTYLLLKLLLLLYRSHLSYLWVPFVAMLFNFNAEASLFSPAGPGNFQVVFLVSLYVLAIQKYQRKGNS